MTQTSRLVIELDSRDAEQKATDVRKALGALEDAGLSIKPAMDKARDGMESMGKGAEKASKSIEDEREEIEQLLSSIDPLTRKMNELEKQELALAKARKSGKIDLDTYNDYQDKLKSTRSALTGFNSDLNKTGMSAKATAAALRGVPAQFTDIATSLQGGQAPLTVFLQQGGQLKDMFGGAGPAAKALGGYVLGLINPLTVAAAAIGTLGVAYYQGSKEADAYRLSIVTTGNAAGTTTDALASMAVRIGSTVGTTGEAAAALALLASNGKIASDGFEQIATSAISFERATGKAVSDTVSEFAALADDPVKAVAALNEKYNFLTASVYEQIRAAQDMGEKEAAASIAQEAYAKALDARSKTMRDSLGIVEKAWGGITKAAKDSWDAMLGVGRTQSLDEQIANTKQLLADRKDSFVSKLFPDYLGQNSQSTKFLEQRLKLLEQQREVLVDQGKAEGENARIQREGLAAYDGFQKSIEGNFSKTQKMNKALEDEEKRIAAARLAGYTITAEQEAAAYKAIRENSTYKEAAAKKEKAYTEDAGTKMLDQARKQYAVLQQQGLLIDNQANGTKALGTEAKKLIELEQQIADIKGKQTLTADQKSILAMAELNIAQQKRNAELEKEVELKKQSTEETRKLAAFQENLNSQLDLAREGLSNQLAGFGMGDKARQRLQEDLKIQQSYQKQMNELTKSFNESDRGEFSQDRYDKETAMIKAALDERIAAQQGYYQDLDSLQSDWTNGANAAWRDYADEANDIAGQTYDAFRNAFDGLEDVFVDFITTGKASFKDFANSVLADLARIVVKQQIIAPLLNAVFGGGGNSGGATSFGGAVGSMLGGSGSGGSDSSGWGGMVGLGKNLYSVWNAVTGVGAEIASGYATGGLTGAASAGAGYYGTMISNMVGTISGGLQSVVSAITGQTAANAATSAALQGAVTEGAVTIGSNLGIGGVAAEGAAATAGSSGMLASMGAMWPLAVIMGMYQSGKLYDAGVRPDAGEVRDSAGGTTLGKVAMTPGVLQAKALEGIDNALSKVVGGKWAAILSGSTFHQAVWTAVGGKLFGTGYQTKDTGIELGVEGGVFDAQQYTKQKKKGGLISGKSKTRYLYSDLDAETEDALGSAYNEKIFNSMGLFSALGVQLSDSVLDGLNVAATRISTQDKTPEAIQAELDAWFTGLGDSAVAAISDATNSGISNYSFDNLTTFVNNLYSINDVFKLINVNALPVSVWGGKLAEQYVAMAGGMEALSSSVTGYYNAFFTETERADDTLDAISKQFASMNLALPDSRDGFRAMVEGIDSTTDAGRSMFLTLMGLSTSAASAFDILEQREGAANEALIGSAAAAQSALQRAISAQKDSINDLLTTANTKVSDLTGVSNDLGAALKALRGDSDDAVKMLRAQAQATLQNALTTARAGGSLAGFEGLSDALDTVSSNSTDLYSTLEDFNRDQGRSAVLIDELNTLNGKQLTNAEKTVKALQDQLERLDDQLEFAQAQMDALNGVDTSVMGVTAAVNAMNAAVVAAIAAINGKSTPTNAGVLIDTIYKDVLGRDADAGGKQYWQDQLDSGALNNGNIVGAITNAAAIEAAYKAAGVAMNDGASYWAGQLSSGALTAAQLQEAVRNAAIANGSISGYANGGLISGPGTGTSDSIFARLSNGEYVMSADSVRMFGTGMLDQMNAGQLPAFAGGGAIRLVGAGSSEGAAGSSYSGSKSASSMAMPRNEQGVIDAINGLQNYLYMITKYSEQTASGVRRQNEMQEAA